MNDIDNLWSAVSKMRETLVAAGFHHPQCGLELEKRGLLNMDQDLDAQDGLFTVRSTFEPDREYRVDQEEFDHLVKNNLLVQHVSGSWTWPSKKSLIECTCVSVYYED